MKVIATGGLAGVIAQETDVIQIIAPLAYPGWLHSLGPESSPWGS